MIFVPMIARMPEESMQGLETDWMPSTGDMDSAIAELRGKIRAFASETTPQLTDVPDVSAWLVAWNQFVADFNAIDQGLWFDRWNRRDQILASRGRFNGLVEWWKRLPGASSTVLTPTYTAPQVDPGTDLKDLVHYAAIGLVALAAVVALGQLGNVTKALGMGAKA